MPLVHCPMFNVCAASMARLCTCDALLSQTARQAAAVLKKIEPSRQGPDSASSIFKNRAHGGHGS